MFTTLLFIAAAAAIFRKKTMISPVKGKVTSGFGMRTFRGQTHFHNGNDIGCNVGTPVVAPANGTVIKAWNDTTYGGGLSLIILHDDGSSSGFAHLSEFKAAVNQKVKAGDTVALSGNTGYSSGPHLHFTFVQNGQAVDALKTGLFKTVKKSDGSTWFE